MSVWAESKKGFIAHARCTCGWMWESTGSRETYETEQIAISRATREWENHRIERHRETRQEPE